MIAANAQACIPYDKDGLKVSSWMVWLRYQSRQFPLQQKLVLSTQLKFAQAVRALSVFVVVICWRQKLAVQYHIHPAVYVCSGALRRVLRAPCPLAQRWTVWQKR
jgi:hypothetical protein